MPQGRVVRVGIPAEAADRLVDVLLAASAFSSALIGARDPEPVLVTGAVARATAVAVRSLFAGEVLVQTDRSESAERDVRAQLAERHPSKRAGTIVTTDELRSAVKSVRRGGRIAASPETTGLPSVTEVVQREVSIVAPRDVTALLNGLTEPEWDELVNALSGALPVLEGSLHVQQ